MRKIADFIRYKIGICTFLLLLINIALLITGDIQEEIYTDSSLHSKYALAWWLVLDNKEYYRLFTYMFLHSGLAHLFNNSIVLVFVGGAVERILGTWKYLAAYFGCGIVAGLVSIMWNRAQFMSASGAYAYSVGASGAIFGIVGVMLWIVIINRGRVENISLRQLLLFAALSIYSGLTTYGIDNAAHIGGLVFGLLSAVILYREQR